MHLYLPQLMPNRTRCGLCFLGFLQVAQSVSVWKQRVVVTAAALPQDLKQALLTAGATAVVCWNAESSPVPPNANVAGYFQKFYTMLLGKGGTISAAMDVAGKLKSVIARACCALGWM